MPDSPPPPARRLRLPVLGERPKEPEEDDPLALEALSFPASEGEVREMAAGIADEYARLGASRDEILAMFREPAYGLTHAVWRARGEAWCAAVIDEVMAAWGFEG